MYKNRKAVSPVIATVILVAVAITISVAVAYWMGGISSQYTKFEKVEISSAVCTKNPTNWTIALDLKNTGTAQATIMDVFVNDRKLGTTIVGVAAGQGGSTISTGLTLSSGQTSSLTVLLKNGGIVGDPFYNISSGTTVNIKLHSAGGMDYLKLVELV